MKAESASRAAESRGGVLLFIGAIFASAFLIFLVQPMVGKRILPWFGGVPAVWTLCLAFYQTTLFLGYAYAHALNRFAPAALHPWIHGLAVMGAALSLPVLPGEGWQPEYSSDPSLRILAMLAANVALPFLVLASSGPLVQLWFARRYPSRSPYPLYAVSNFGSLLALVSYPILFEPRLSLSATDPVWSVAFIATALCVLGCAVLARGAAPQALASERGPAPDERPPRTPALVALWLGLPGCAVIMLMAVTGKLSLDVASVPFLWMLPLATYLITFILCFASERTYILPACIALSLLALPVVAAPVALSRWLDLPILAFLKSLPVQVAGYCTLLFGVCMILHGELYRLRPAPRSLTAFYLCVSGGGAIGGLFVGILAPLVFSDYFELPLGLTLAFVLLVAANFRSSASPSRERAGRGRRMAAVLLAVPWLGLIIWMGLVMDRMSTATQTPVLKERGFFGVVRVATMRGPKGTESRWLLHGSTLHGTQSLEDSGRREPTTYYARSTGLGLVLSARKPGEDTRIGVVGLGVGTLSAYGRAGDTIRFYELDPAIVRIARDSGLFTFMADSPATVEVVVGDARRMLEREQERGETQDFDVLIIDAFTSDAVPVHLLTREAFEVYASALAPEGMLAIHTSNRHFALARLASRIGREAGFASLEIFRPSDPARMVRGSEWVLLLRDRHQLRSLRRTVEIGNRARGTPRSTLRITQPLPVELKHIPVWTDDYSDLFRLLARR